MNSADTLTTGLIGRDREVRALFALVDSAARAQGGALFVRGGAGIGKSALLGTAKAHAMASRFRSAVLSAPQRCGRIRWSGSEQGQPPYSNIWRPRSIRSQHLAP